MISQRSSGLFLAAVVAILALLSATNLVTRVIRYKNKREGYCESNYMKSRKAERKFQRICARITDHERRLLKVEGLSRG